MGVWYEKAVKQRQIYDRQGACLSDAQAAQNVKAYPAWAAGIGITQEKIDAGQNRYRVGDQLYKTEVAHTTIDAWRPELAPTVWTPIDVEHAGTISDPIPAAVGLEYVYGLYYLDPEDNKIYICKRQGEPEGGTITLHYLPHDLVGSYFELAEEAAE